MPLGYRAAFLAEEIMTKYFYEETAASTASQLSLAAHSLLKRKLSEHFNVSIDEIQIKKDSRGAPFVDFTEGVFVSLTHTKGLVACAFSDNRVGIDAELINSRRKQVEKRVFNEGEISLIDLSASPDTSFFALWTLKESWLKAKGTGFSDNAKEIEFYSLTNPVLSNKSDCSFTVDFINGYAVSLCVFKTKN